jgi:hypothetical protein
MVVSSRNKTLAELEFENEFLMNNTLEKLLADRETVVQ